MSRKPEISFICPVEPDSVDLPRVHREFAEALVGTGRDAEFIYVIDGRLDPHERALGSLADERYPVRVYRMAKGFGEATALQFGFEHSRGRLIVTLPNCPQIEARTLLDVLEQLDRGAQVVVTRRDPRTDAWLNRVQSNVFHFLIRNLVGRGFRDMTCGLRGMSREAALRLDLYGDQHRFIPVIATRCGYEVVEIPGAQHEANRGLRLRGPGVYFRRLLDILNIYFLARFTRKPLRFFGLIGLITGIAGAAITGLLGVERILGLTGLANRPLLLLGVLLLVLGVQLTSIGLVGEIIIFLAARRDMPEADEIGASTAEPSAIGAATRRDGD